MRRIQVQGYGNCPLSQLGTTPGTRIAPQILLRRRISEELLDEYREVFVRAKFAGLDLHLVTRLLTLVADEATLVTPANRLTESPDESDNRFYECAAAAEADYIVTGNIKHFKKPYKTTKIVTARQFLALLAPDK